MVSPVGVTSGLVSAGVGPAVVGACPAVTGDAAAGAGIGAAVDGLTAALGVQVKFEGSCLPGKAPMVRFSLCTTVGGAMEGTGTGTGTGWACHQGA